MYWSVGLFFLLGVGAGKLCQKLGLPALFGYLLSGMLLGPFGLDLIDPLLFDLSPFLRRAALVTIMIRAGLGFDRNALKKNGRSALLLCFVPATFEILGYAFLGRLLQLSWLDSLLLGCVMAAVSPAVVVPRMLKIDHEGYGKDHGVAQVIMAGASVDDIFVITLFSTILDLALTHTFSWTSLFSIPFSILTGIAIGIALGKLVQFLFERMTLSLIYQVLFIYSICFLLSAFEEWDLFPFASLISIVLIAYSLKSTKHADALQSTFDHLWVWLEMVLFGLVGMIADPTLLFNNGLMIVLILLIALLFRMFGVYLSLLGSKQTWNERLFSMIAYSPKATVQAAIGPLALAVGLQSGPILLAFAIASILITAPIGAFLIDHTYNRLLKKDQERS